MLLQEMKKWEEVEDAAAEEAKKQTKNGNNSSSQTYRKDKFNAPCYLKLKLMIYDPKDNKCRIWIEWNAMQQQWIALVWFALDWFGMVYKKYSEKNLNLTQLKDRLDSRSAQNLKTMSCELNIERLGEICQGW